MSTEFQDDVSQGFSAGNYASAYETEDLETALVGLTGVSDAYRSAFILGFFASYELHEIPGSDREEYDTAYFSAAGQRAIEAGYLDDRSNEYKEENQ